MISEIRKITMEQWFIIVSFCLSMILSFLFGYTVFRYWTVDLCKTPMQVLQDDGGYGGRGG